MVKLVEGMELLQERARSQIRIRQLEAEIIETRKALAEADEDRRLLAKSICREGDFLDWLVDQDVSSAHMRKPWRQRDAEVEGKTDLELALAYANRPNAG